MSKPTCNIGASDERGGYAESGAQSVLRSGADPFQQVLEFGPTEFNRIEVRGVRRCKEDAGSAAFDDPADHNGTMSRKVVHHDDIVLSESRQQVFTDEVQEHICRRAPFDVHEGRETSSGERPDHRRHGSAIARHVPDSALAQGSSRVLRCHGDVRSRLVNEDELVGWNLADLLDEPFPMLDHRGALSLRWNNGLFFRVNWSRSRTARPRVASLTHTPVRSPSSTASSGSVMSALASRISRSTSRPASSIFESLPPVAGLGLISPVCRNCRMRRFTDARPTSKRSATSCQVTPPLWTALMIRSRRSKDRGAGTAGSDHNARPDAKPKCSPIRRSC